MGTRTYRTVLIGAGNVASFLKANIKPPFLLTCIGGRQRTCPIPQDADLYIIAISDRAINAVGEELKGIKGLVVHTAGSVPMDVLPQRRRGVFYPLQTLSKKRHISASCVPLYIEASQPQDLELLRLLAESIGSKAEQMDSQHRKYLHLAAVFCCNFVNRLYGITAELLADHDIPFSAMLPLIKETADKVSELTPSEAQTGPAVRWDEQVMTQQMALLNEEQRKLYQLLSQSIHNDKLRFDKDKGTSL